MAQSLMLTEGALGASSASQGLNPGVLEYQFEMGTPLTLTDLAQLASSGAQTASQTQTQLQLPNLKNTDSNRTLLHVGYISIQKPGPFTFHLNPPGVGSQVALTS